ncbi:hypothetical protein FZEAL_5810 [Fusarium zealandicum]|uniref:Shugoshin n=1 Tax=Fusarium zealandicum TaxID=1053134 RepID=A0A8H4UJY1_9HYPO|nr:hypothetical protein FZEAL_5810 [Fusarium zealandicum]
MARLNEPPVSTDSLETLRKKLLRQNRDLAKSNNLRALRIRELENDCACMLSENLELRGRILELEKELDDNDTRRIADHALAIKAKLESQMTEWATLLAGLGLEPPMKRHSPRPRKSTKQRVSFSSARPSPSQRRLRDIAREIEELGHISETKSYPRQSMNHEQILALRSKADDATTAEPAESPELGPPPMSQFIDEDPVKVDSPSRPRPVPAQESPQAKLAPPETLISPQVKKTMPRPSSPDIKKEEDTVEPEEAVVPKEAAEPKEAKPTEKKQQETEPMGAKPLETKSQETNPKQAKEQKMPVVDAPAPQPVKAGSKRKFAARDDTAISRQQRINNENEPPRVMADKQSIRDKAGGRTLKELASMRKDARERVNATGIRKPLAAKSTNGDMSSPKKTSKPAPIDEVTAAKAEAVKVKASLGRPKSKSKPQPVTIEAVPDPEPTAPAVTELPWELGTPFAEQGLLSPSSPDTAASGEVGRGATPPPADIDATREPSRPSRRNRTAVSYAEPNLRDKMRRPTKDMLDAVTGEGRHARRSSAAEQPAPDTVKVKRESDVGDSWKKLPLANAIYSQNEPGSIPASPLAGKGSSPELPKPIAIRGGRRSSMLIQQVIEDHMDPEEDEDSQSQGTTTDSASLSEADVYDFAPSSPQPEKQAPVEAMKKTGGRRVSRRVSSAIQSEEALAGTDRVSARRRSMML